MPENKEGPGFKFIDRRRVDETGESREVEVPEAKTGATGSSVTNPAPATSTAKVESSPSEVGSDQAEDPESGPITFSLFLQSLAQQALMAMGVIPWPDSGLVKANLEHARETIDILTILHEKTNGNLTAAEKRFFDSVLYELKVAFVEILKRGKA